MTASVELPRGVTTPVSVLLVAGTLTRLRQLERHVSGPGFMVTASVRDAEAAERMVRSCEPSAVLMDLDLFGGGLDTIERIMAGRPTPIVVCGAAAEHPEAALAAGAVDVVGALDVAPGSPGYADVLRRHLKMASRVPVITHPRARLRARLKDRGVGLDAENNAPLNVVAIGASTGGPPALATILGDIPADLGAAIVVVQHMAEGFVEGLARWLDGVCALTVVVAADGERLSANTVYLAPAGSNLVIRRGYRLELCEPPQGQFHLPGIDVTFRSVAEVCGNGAVGLLLTGMGKDGAVGLRAMRDAGAFTIGQDEPTSVVWGMPAAAQAMDAVDVELPLPAIAAGVVGAIERITPRKASRA